MAPAPVVVLNGAPRSGKSTIARALIDRPGGPWANLGVDTMQAATPERLLPGMGLRPGGEWPDLEPFVVAAFEAMYSAVASLSASGIGVAVDVGHHDAYSQPLGILRRSAAQLAGAPVLFVGVRCPIETVMARRAEIRSGEQVLERAQRWDEAVHRPGMYDLEVDTSVLSPGDCAARIEGRLAAGPGRMFAQVANWVGEP
ncbi:MAG: chloramphenicol phosphotransferase [Chloroflexi bacterium]|nr:chloramphenicol phosphotransferase [Chloroflexota bacterium]